jgi:P2 family phage major capsid protein
MKTETRVLYNSYLSDLAKHNGIERADTASKFSVAPSVQQRLETRLQETSEFLRRINIIGVSEQQGEKIGLGITGPNASTTDTAQQDRQPANLLALDGNKYFCSQTNFDTFITYAQLDAWAKFPDFTRRLRAQIMTRQALDRIMIGFNGTSRSATSDPAAHPLREDVNVGWLQKLRDEAPQRVMSDTGTKDGKVTIGATGDYKNLDALVSDAVASLIEPWYREDPGLVAICGRELVHDKYFPIINADLKPVDMVAADIILSSARIGGLQAVRVPFFPKDKILITKLSNLSLYYQEGARRRTIKDEARRDRIENYESSNDAYVIEDLQCAAMVENIAIV